MKDEFTHLKDDGVHMVEVGDKSAVRRTAIAEGEILLDKKTVDLIRESRIKKGNVLATAQIAAIGAVKNTWNIIPSATRFLLPVSMSGSLWMMTGSR